MTRLSVKLLCLLLPGLLWAAETPERKPITVEADRLEMNNTTGVSRYQGNVVMTQGSLLLRADNVVLHSQGKTLQRAEASGSPVYIERPDPQSGELMKANAAFMAYQIPEGILEMKGEAHLWRGKDEFSGERIVYELDKRVVRAGGQKNGEEQNGRVKVILQPATQEQETTP
jgi:lipopolysaccharide export system protein LptA